MSSLKESIEEALNTLPTIYTYSGPDKVVHPEDPNLKDISHFAETIQKVCNLSICDLSPNQDLSKEQVVEIVELVERELLSHPSEKLFRRNNLVSDLRAIRVKHPNQLIEELNNIGNEVLKKYPQIGTTREEAIMKSLFMWDGCLNIDKVCRSKDIHGIEPQDRTQIHNWLVNKSNSNPWIRKGFASARYFRQTPDQINLKNYSWIPSNSPYWINTASNKEKKQFKKRPRK